MINLIVLKSKNGRTTYGEKLDIVFRRKSSSAKLASIVLQEYLHYKLPFKIKMD